MMSRTLAKRGVQPSSCRILLLAATNTAGSPARRGPTSPGIGWPGDGAGGMSGSPNFDVAYRCWNLDRFANIVLKPTHKRSTWQKQQLPQLMQR